MSGIRGDALSFLSCLCGSELNGQPDWIATSFLSCLCGSEPFLMASLSH
tara:strand:+ start:1995 stop:2141 length:147 start_codon:yes stop_codon:yes gene_type:complete